MKQLVIVGMAASSFNVLCNGLIMASHLRYTRIRIFSRNLATYAVSCDFLINLMTIVFDSPSMSQSTVSCQVTAFALQYFSIAAFLWIASISFALLYVSMHLTQNVVRLESTMTRFHAFCWGTPILMASVPIITGSLHFSPYKTTINILMILQGTYENLDDGWCWIGDEGKGRFQRMMLFYFPLWIIIGFALTVAVFVEWRVSIKC
jgi:hypothetical protein